MANLDQELVANLVAKAVIDQFEIIQIDIGDNYLLPEVAGERKRVSTFSKIARRFGNPVRASV